MSNDYLSLIENNPIAIGKECGFNDLTELHNDWIKTLLFSNDDETLQAHRGSYKTSVVALCLALLIVLRPNKALGFFRKTDTDAKIVIKLVAKLLKTDIFRIMVRSLYGIDLVLTEESGNNITTNLFQYATGQSQLEGKGIDSSLTGRHYDYIFTDDIITLLDRRSRAEREKTKQFYMELQNIKNRSGWIRNTGTPWHKNDCFEIMPTPKRFDCYSTGLIPRNELNSIRSSMTNALFAANYELKHIASDDVIFTEPKFIPFTEAIFNGICHVDARYTGTDGTAFTILKKQPTGRYVGFGKRWNKHVDDCISEIELLKAKYRAGTIYLENNADKGYLAKDCRKRGMQTREYHESMNKYVKITTYLKAVWNLIDWLDETDPDYINEILDYNEQADHDDSPDSAASLIRESEIVTKWGW